MKLWVALMAVGGFGLLACNNGAKGTSGGGTNGGVKADAGGPDLAKIEDLDMQASDFECILGWPKVRAFRITNRLGHMQEALAVANSPTGGKYPVGTIIQLVPGEASVKRAVGWSPTTDDWEFFFLTASKTGTVINARGTTGVMNQFGGNCFNCHMKAQPQWDLLCEMDHGCDPLPLSAQQIEDVQNSDPRCP
jgi:hypothetical protein